VKVAVEDGHQRMGLADIQTKKEKGDTPSYSKASAGECALTETAPLPRLATAGCASLL